MGSPENSGTFLSGPDKILAYRRGVERGKTPPSLADDYHLFGPELFWIKVSPKGGDLQLVFAFASEEMSGLCVLAAYKCSHCGGWLKGLPRAGEHHYVLDSSGEVREENWVYYCDLDKMEIGKSGREFLLPELSLPREPHQFRWEEGDLLPERGS